MRPSSAHLVGSQVKHQLVTFVRTPVAVFFTVMLPLIMLVLFNALLGNEQVETAQGSWPLRQFYVGGIAAFTAVSATFTNLANTVPIRRDEGILKRWRGTPLPAWACIAGFIGAAIVVAAAGVVFMFAVGIVGYGIELDPAKLPVAVVTFVVAVASFAALGIAVASIIPSADAAPAVANAIILPLGFISDVFIQIDEPPRWLAVIGDIFPLKPLAQTFQDVFNPSVDAPAFQWDRLLRIAVWGIAGTIAAVRLFRWEPSLRSGSRAGRRRGTRRRSVQPTP
ncbi:MAG: ABC transporter permease [Actinomycetota bacterium]|nr:ABC transporter permease [Acidimicrobiia bacterium]MDQ3469443.1 ABC transporter permease [Actinomycetota bacterium]